VPPRALGEKAAAGDLLTAELLYENETFMVCVALSPHFTLTRDNASLHGLDADLCYTDPADGRYTWDTRWMGKVKAGDLCIKVRKFEWCQAGSALYQLTDKEFVCFTDELRCKLLSSHFKEVPVRRSSRVGCNLEECHGFKMSAKYRLCSEMKSYMLSLVPDDNEV
jgi:hypothetical protein